MLLPMELDHRVVHPQQDLDVVVVVGSMPARPPPGAVDSLLQNTQSTAEAVQAVWGDPWKEREDTACSSSPGSTRPLQPEKNPTQMQLGPCKMPVWPPACHHQSTVTQGTSVPISRKSKLRFRQRSCDGQVSSDPGARKPTARPSQRLGLAPSDEQRGGSLVDRASSCHPFTYSPSAIGLVPQVLPAHL